MDTHSYLLTFTAHQISQRQTNTALRNVPQHLVTTVHSFIIIRPMVPLVFRMTVEATSSRLNCRDQVSDVY